jgi:hypothetical protein
VLFSWENEMSKLQKSTQRDALLQVAIDFIASLTGMKPPPIETAPPETFAPFYDFVDKVQALTDAVEQQEPTVRYCPDCGSVGQVPATADDCCPDGMHARMVPLNFAKSCAATFSRAVAALALPDAQPVACEHAFYYFGDQKVRRCNWCNKIEVAPQPIIAPEQVKQLLSICEQQAVLNDLMGLECLINYRDCQATMGDAIEHGFGDADEKRSRELLAIGRAIIEKDPDLWSDESKKEFNLRYGEVKP